MTSLVLRRSYRVLTCVALSLALLVATPPAAEAQTGAAPPDADPSLPSPHRPVPFRDAIAAAARKLFDSLRPPEAGKKVEVAIDPLVDGATGVHTVAAGLMGQQIVAIAAQEFPHINIVPFSQEVLARSPFLLIGTITA